MPVENRSVKEVEKLLEGRDHVMLNVVRITAPLSSSGLPSSASPTVDSFKSHETSSSKSSLTHLLSPNEFTSSEGESSKVERPTTLKGAKHSSVQTDEKRNSWGGSSKEDNQFDDFTPNGHDWQLTIKENPQYSSQRAHASSEPCHRNDPWEERKDSGSVRRRSDRFSSPQFKSSDHTRDNAFVSSPQRRSLKEPKRRSFHQTQGSGDSMRELKRQSLPVPTSPTEDIIPSKTIFTTSSKGDVLRSPDGPPGYVDPPPAHSSNSSRQGSPRVDPFTEHRRKKSSRSEINRTWPKSRNPPDFISNHRESSSSHKKKKTKRKTIPIMTPESMSADEENDESMVPPIPPSRTSSFRAWRQQTPVVAESPTETAPQLPPKISVSTAMSLPSPERSPTKSVDEDRDNTVPSDNPLCAMHYATTSLPATNVDFDAVTGNANTTFRPISTPSIPEQTKNNSAIQSHTQRPNQLEVATPRYYSPQQNSHYVSRRTPSPSTPQYYERRGRHSSRSSTESMSGLYSCQPSNAMLVRLQNNVPYYTVRSQPLADPRQAAIPGFPRTHPRGPRNSLHSLSSEDERAPSRNSLPEWNMRFPPQDIHHSLEFPGNADGLTVPVEGYHRPPPGYDPGPNGYNSLPPLSHNKRVRMTPSSRASPGSAGQSNSSLEKGKIFLLYNITYS